MTTIANAENRAAKTNNAGANERGYLVPQVNIVETKDSLILEAEMPGVSKDGLEITLEGNELTFTGHRQEDIVNGELIYRESRPFDYRRTFELDPTIDTAKINAKIDQGVLTLRLPKLEKVKPRKITIGD